MSQTKLISLDNLTRYDGKIKQLITTVTPASATPESVASAGSVGTSTKYAREDHTHAISVATGDANGQVKIAGQNASVKGFGDKQDKFERISYADWQLLTPQQQAAKPYYIYDYPSSAITAGNVAYDNTSSGMSADDVQEAVDELKSGLTNLIVLAKEIITTDSDGDGSLSINNLDGQVISASATGVIVTPWVHSGDYKWYVRIIGSNGLPFTGQASITYAYTPRNQ